MNQMKVNNSKLNLVSKEDLVIMLREAKNGNIDARNQAITCNLGLVKYRVNIRFSFSQFDKEDLFSIGVIGLIKAVDSYDFNKGANFSTYAIKCIDNEILLVLRRKHFEIESLDNYHDEGDMYDFLCSEGSTSTRVIEEEYEKKEMYNIIDSLVSELPEIDRQVVELYFGFYNRNEIQQKDIAKKLSISQPWVSRTLAKSLKTIKSKIEDMDNISEVKGFYDANQIPARYQVRSNSIYDFFHDYSKSVVDAMLTSLSKKERELVRLRYDKSRGKSVYQRFNSIEDYTTYYNTVVPKMKRYIEDIALREESGDDSFNIIDATQIELPNQELVNFVLEKYSRTEAIIVALKFGYYDGKHYSTNEIAHILKLDLPQVYDILKSTLEMYRNYLDSIKEVTKVMSI